MYEAFVCVVRWGGVYLYIYIAVCYCWPRTTFLNPQTGLRAHVFL